MVVKQWHIKAPLLCKAVDKNNSLIFGVHTIIAIPEGEKQSRKCFLHMTGSREVAIFLD